jgi:hypothetical protein
LWLVGGLAAGLNPTGDRGELVEDFLAGRAIEQMLLQGALLLRGNCLL